jgi:hypothetical protein
MTSRSIERRTGVLHHRSSDPVEPAGFPLNANARLPALEDVDTVGVDQVCADRDVEAANCPASLFDDAQGRRNSSFGTPNQPANTDKSRTVARPLIE